MSESDLRRSLRVEPRGLVPRTGKLLLGSQATPIDCQVVNLSAGGACLKMSVLQKLPKRFEFLHGVTRKLAQPVWERGYLIGICYEASNRCSDANRASRVPNKASGPAGGLRLISLALVRGTLHKVPHFFASTAAATPSTAPRARSPAGLR